MPVILGLGRLKQEDSQEFEANRSYIASLGIRSLELEGRKILPFV